MKGRVSGAGPALLLALYAQFKVRSTYGKYARVVRLSDSNYASYSVAALGVTAHEVGHAIQHATLHGAMRLRTALVPVAGIGSNLGYVL